VAQDLSIGGKHMESIVQRNMKKNLGIAVLASL
jgi:hypothetical protein